VFTFAYTLGTLANSYGSLDRLLAQSTTLGTVGYAYDALGRRTQLNIPGVAPTLYGYDENSRLKHIIRGTQTAALEYDDAGRRTALTLPNSVRTEYQYDDASRPTALIYRSATGILGDLTYQYDPTGYRSRVGGSFARTLLPTAASNAAYDQGNRQLAFGSSQMTFDPNGNLVTLTDGTQTASLSWDARDRLTALEQPGVVASFAYAFDRRVAKTVNGLAAKYLYDGPNIAQQLEIQRTTTYLSSLAIDETLGLTSSDGSFFLSADALGSTLSVSDTSGSAVTEYTYATFGAVSATNSVVPNPFQFTGRENDGATGLYYYRARYYSPAAARFVTQDPSCWAAGPNFYSYVRNNPINRVDPTGLIEIPETLREEVVKELLGLVLEKGVGGVTGAICASRYCKRGVANVSELHALGECTSVFDRYKLPSGPVGGPSDDFLQACGAECSRITKHYQFRSTCKVR
jgi:RHS repeat-associated protein